MIEGLLNASRHVRPAAVTPAGSGEETARVPAQDGMNYAPSGPPKPVCSPGDFVFAAVGLDHGHITGMCNGLTEAGGQLRWVYDPDPAKAAELCQRYPGAEAAPSEEAVLADERVQLVASAAVPAHRAGLGLRVLEHGKHYFTDKPPMTTLDTISETGAVLTTGSKTGTASIRNDTRKAGPNPARSARWPVNSGPTMAPRP